MSATAAETAAPKHLDVGPAELELTDAGGAFLHVPRGVTTATIASRDLRAIDLRDCPDLVHVDLSGCAPGLHVTALACPSLVSLALPDHGPGAVLHIDFGPRLPELRATGRVADLDACWLDEDHPPPPPGTWGADHGLGPLRGRESRGPLSGISLGRPDAEPGDAEFVILYAGEAPSRLELPASAREVLLHEVVGLRTLASGEGGDLRVVDLGSLPDLVELVGPVRARSLRFEDVPSLTLLEWTAGRVVLVRSGATSVVVENLVDELVAVGSAIESLEARYTDRISLISCPSLGRLVAAPRAHLSLYGAAGLEEIEGADTIEVKRVTLRDILGGSFRSDSRLATPALRWLGARHGPADTLDAIQVLHACALRGWDPGEVWEQRCALHARACLDRGLAEDALRWDWDFPTDLADRGWEADLRLWRICRQAREQAPAAPWIDPWPDPVEYGYTLAQSAEPEHVLALATAAARLAAADRDADDLVQLLVDALGHGAERGGVLGRLGGKLKHHSADHHVVQGVRAEAYDRVRGVMNGLMRLRTHTDAPALVRLLCLWIGRRMPYAQGVDLLGALRDLGAAEATVALAAIASKTADPDLKQHTLALLMRTPTRDVFAFPGDEA